MSVLVLPGDEIEVDSNKNIVTGPGVRRDAVNQDCIIAVNTGMLVRESRSKGSENVYVEYDSRRYVPGVGDYVIGIITGAFGDSYKVSLSSFSTSVVLSYMAFPNASKKNRPTLKVGDLVYARVCSAKKELEAEIECMDSSTGQEAGFGHLEDGMVVDVSLQFARRVLFEHDFPLLTLLGQHAKFEVAIGLNGKIWIKCENVLETLACYRIIMACQDKPVTEYKKLVSQIFKELAHTAEE